MSKLRVTKIEFTTKRGKSVELSLEEAKDFYEQLHEMFGKRVEYVNRNFWDKYNPYWYCNPVYGNLIGGDAVSVAYGSPTIGNVQFSTLDNSVRLESPSGLTTTFTGVAEK